jgi:hypothetical protein
VEYVLLCEQERILSAEQNLINNHNAYTTTSTSLATINDYGNITVPSGGALVYFTAGLIIDVNADSNSTAWGDFILEVAGGGAIAGKQLSISGTAPLTGTAQGVMGCVIFLNAGSYDVKILGIVDSTATLAMVYNCVVGITSFNDLSTVAYNYTTGLTNAYITVNSRTTPLGPLNQAVCAINVGTNGAIATSLYVGIDGVTIYPDEDAGINGSGWNVYKFYVPVSIGTQHQITITTTGGAMAYWSIIATPWLLTLAARNGHSPVSLSFPQNSTMYVNLGSLYYDSTKDAHVGTPKGVSWGTNDYYASGTVASGILAFSYTFTSVNVSLASWNVDGLGGCVENIGVDMP